MIIAHLFKEDDNRWKIQSNEEHCAGVAGLASRFAGEFGMSSWGGLIGFLHDKGKESNAFQQHIKKVSGYSPEVKVIGNYHHAYVGGAIVGKQYGKSADNLIVN